MIKTASVKTWYFYENLVCSLMRQNRTFPALWNVYMGREPIFIMCWQRPWRLGMPGIFLGDLLAWYIRYTIWYQYHLPTWINICSPGLYGWIGSQWVFGNCDCRLVAAHCHATLPHIVSRHRTLSTIDPILPHFRTRWCEEGLPRVIVM